MTSRVVVCLALLASVGLSACQQDQVDEKGGESTKFGFPATAALLQEREISIEPLMAGEEVLSHEEFVPFLEKRMARRGSWKVLSTHLAELDNPNDHFEIFHQPTYVVEITGPATGNCFDFYLATNGDYRGSACFYPTRS